MTIGMQTYERIRRAEERAAKHGFSFASDRWGRDRDIIYLTPKDESYPFYKPGAEIFGGNLDDVEAFLSGLEFARQYDRVCGLKTDERRAVAEQKFRNKKLVNMIKGEPVDSVS